MPRTTQCPNCGVVLSLPEDAAGKRLKCPRCATRFFADGDSGAAPAPKPPLTPPGADQPRPASSLLLTARPSDPDVPRAERDLRETFDPKLLLGEAEPSAGPGGGKGASAGGKGDAGASGAADAAALFEDAGPPKRKEGLAEARSKPRRCPTCSAVVPAGMSLCSRCGLDLDTGQRHVMHEILDEELPPPPKAPLPPIGIMIVGGVALAVGLASAILALLAAQRTEAGSAGRYGFFMLGAVAAFGIYAAVQFLRARSLKLLVVALMLGAFMDVLLLIALPLYDAINWQEPAAPVIGLEPSDEDLPKIPPLSKRLEPHWPKIEWGIALLLIDAGALIYLSTPAVRRHFDRSRPPASGPMVPIS